MGMPLYGQSFQLEQASTNGLNSRAPGPGQAGEFTRAAGFLAYYEVKSVIYYVKNLNCICIVFRLLFHLQVKCKIHSQRSIASFSQREECIIYFHPTRNIKLNSNYYLYHVIW